MNPTAIFSKTGKGVQEASGKTSNLSRADRAVLKEIDGKTALQNIAVKFEKISADKFDALIALGAVIRGETYHFEVVSNESAGGVMTVQLDTGIPIANGILTTDNDEQAKARMHEKGVDCARVAVEMSNLLKAIDEEQ